MKRISLLLLFAILLIGCKNSESEDSQITNTDQPSETQEKEKSAAEFERERILRNKDLNKPTVVPISHATFYMVWDGQVIYLDPVGGKEAFGDAPSPDFILVTDIHGDHMNAETIQAVKTDKTKIYASQAVKDQLPKSLNVNVLNNGMTTEVDELTIQAVPMYNLTEERLKFHPKGRGNGYVLTKYNYNVYVSGDTEDIPEMRQLDDIDMAFVCMNLPYTMTVEQAASAVLDFQPRTVVPFHYRGQDGYADVDKFTQLVNQDSPQINVRQMGWYPESDLAEEN
jgi:L-ascorbate metabolism protein UlaG (beta-lactamase superfamily)